MFAISKNSERVLLGLEAILMTAGVIYHWYCLRSRWIKKKKEWKAKDAKDRRIIARFNAENGDACEIPRKVVPPGYLTPKQHWNTAIFFPDPLYIVTNSKARQLMWYIQQARRMIKVCLYTSTFKMFNQVLFDMAKKGVRVVGISNTEFVVMNWRKKGIMAREKPKMISSAFNEDMFVDTMHNKFIIIDDKAVITGSLNWTQTGVRDNRENVVITTHKNIVPKYVQEFENIWHLSEPDPDEKNETKDKKRKKPAPNFNIREPRPGWTRLRY